MFKLVSDAGVIPRSLYITDVSMGPDAIGSGGYASVPGVKYQGSLVALKAIEKQYKSVSAFRLFSSKILTSGKRSISNLVGKL